MNNPTELRLLRERNLAYALAGTCLIISLAMCLSTAIGNNNALLIERTTVRSLENRVVENERALRDTQKALVEAQAVITKLTTGHQP